jgi:C1A family cysteine protease
MSGYKFNTILNKDSSVVKKQSLVFKSTKKPEDKIKKAMPEIFNPFEVWGSYLSRVKTQGDCGACWAMASAKTLQDRYALISGGRLNIEFSPFMMLMCEGTIFPSIEPGDKRLANINLDAHTEGACNGNTLYTAMNFLYAVGLCDTQCVNRGKFDEYDIKPLETITDPENVPMCQSILGDNYDRCLDRSRAVRFYRIIASYQVENNIESIKEEIFKWGPVASGFQIYKNFMTGYDGTTIYMGPDENDNSPMGGHAIEIVGWGKEDGVAFWWICNSWGPDWGLGGYFRMKMDIKKCQLEENVIACIPDYPGFNKSLLQYNVIKNAEMDSLRDWIGIDPITGYKYTTIEEIKNGALKGDLRPIMDKKDIMNMKTQWAGEIQSYEQDAYYGVYRFQGEDLIKGKEFIFVVAILLVCFIIGVGLKRLRQ